MGDQKTEEKKNPESENWYYVDAAGATKGPHTIAQMKSMYGNAIKDTTFIWNGTSVLEWTRLNKLPAVLIQQLTKPKDQVRGPVNCPGQHGLTKFNTDDYTSLSFTCDVCRARMPNNTTMFGCRQCNWDTCVECKAKGDCVSPNV